jgi:hypothetical protein
VGQRLLRQGAAAAAAHAAESPLLPRPYEHQQQGAPLRHKPEQGQQGLLQRACARCGDPRVAALLAGGGFLRKRGAKAARFYRLADGGGGGGGGGVVVLRKYRRKGDTSPESELQLYGLEVVAEELQGAGGGSSGWALTLTFAHQRQRGWLGGVRRRASATRETRTFVLPRGEDAWPCLFRLAQEQTVNYELQQAARQQAASGRRLLQLAERQVGWQEQQREQEQEQCAFVGVVAGGADIPE